MAYKEELQIEESDNCTVVLRDGHKLAGHMRRWERYYAHKTKYSDKEPTGPILVWCLLTSDGKNGIRRVTWTRNGQFRMGGVSRFDIADFQIGRPPT